MPDNEHWNELYTQESVTARRKLDCMLDVRFGPNVDETKDIFYYLFDFGDCWWHEITLLSIIEVNKIQGYPKIFKKAGDSPDQYPNYDDE